MDKEFNQESSPLSPLERLEQTAIDGDRSEQRREMFHVTNKDKSIQLIETQLFPSRSAELFSWIERILVPNMASAIQQNNFPWREIVSPPKHCEDTWKTCSELLQQGAGSDQFRRIAEYARILTSWLSNYGIILVVDFEKKTGKLDMGFVHLREKRTYKQGIKSMQVFFVPADQKGVEGPEFSEPLHAVLMPDAAFQRYLQNSRVCQQHSLQAIQAANPDMSAADYRRARSLGELYPNDDALESAMRNTILSEELRHGLDSAEFPSHNFFCTPEIHQQRVQQLLKESGRLSSFPGSSSKNANVGLLEFSGKAESMGNGDPRIVLFDCERFLANLRARVPQKILLKELIDAPATTPHEISTILLLFVLGSQKGLCSYPKIDDQCNFSLLESILLKLKHEPVHELQTLIKQATDFEFATPIS